MRHANQILDDALAEARHALKNVKIVPRPTESDLKEFTDDLRRLIMDAPNAVKSPEDVEREFAVIERKLNNLDNRTRAEVAKKDAVTGNAVMEAFLGVKNTLPHVKFALVRQVSDSNDERPVETELATNLVKDYLDNLENITKPPSISDGGESLKNVLDNLGNLPTGSSQEKDDVLTALSEAKESFLGQIRPHVAEMIDPFDRTNLLDTLDKVASLLSGLEQAVATDDYDKVSNLQAQANQLINDVLNKLNAGTVKDAESVSRQLTALICAANVGNGPLTKSSTESLLFSINKLRESSEKVANELPPTRTRKVLEALDKLTPVCDSVVATANDVLKNPSNPELRSKLRNLCGDVDGLVSGITDSLMDKDPDFSGYTILYDDEATGQLISSESSQEDMILQVDEVDDLVFDPTLVTVLPPDMSSPYVKDFAKLKQLVFEVQEVTQKVDPTSVLVTGKKEQSQVSDLSDKLRAMANATPVNSTGYKRDLNRAAENLEKALDSQLAASKNVLENPADPVSRKELESATRRLADAIDRAESVSRQPDLLTNAEKLKEVVSEVVDGVKTGDKDVVDDGCKNLRELGNKIKTQADFMASQNTDPPSRRQIQESLGGFKKALGDFENSVASGSPDAPISGDSLCNAADDVVASTHADVVGDLQRLQDNAEELFDVSQNEDIIYFPDVCENFDKVADEVIQFVTNTVKTLKEPVKQYQATLVIDGVPSAAAALLLAAQNQIDDPKSSLAKEDVKKAVGDLKDVLNTLGAIIENKIPAPPEKQALDRKISPLQTMIPKLQKDNDKLKSVPRDPHLKNKVISDVNKLTDQLLGLADEVASSPEDQLNLKSRTVRGRVRDMVDAINNNSPNFFKHACDGLEKDLPEFQAQVRKVSEKTGGNAEQALQDVDDILPKVSHAAREAQASPEDPKKKHDFRDQAKKLDRALERATENVIPSKDERQVRNAANKLKDDLATLRGVKNPNATPKAAEDFRNVLNTLKKVAHRKEQWSPQVVNPTKELEEAWVKFGVACAQAPTPSDGNETEKTAEEVEKKMTNLVKATNANEVSSVLDAQAMLDDLLAAVDSKEPERIRAKLLGLSDVTRGLQVSLKDSPAEHEARDFIEPVKDVIRKSTEVSRNPVDPMEVGRRISPPFFQFFFPLWHGGRVVPSDISCGGSRSGGINLFTRPRKYKKQSSEHVFLWLLQFKNFNQTRLTKNHSLNYKRPRLPWLIWQPHVGILLRI
eukprot:TRINITY_DN5382_c0_g2_i4.p1 TRINITY_DN5382_c0_g2~~TRINITY_DN5382_c0_g2_i4.p1  ORF type:complete len:1283 (+),score=354.73 TRINITY_DN5382_c0_g2_i4:159-3851(+)